MCGHLGSCKASLLRSKADVLITRHGKRQVDLFNALNVDDVPGSAATRLETRKGVIYLGSFSSAKDTGFLQVRDVRGVLNVAGDCLITAKISGLYDHLSIKWLQLPCDDRKDFPLDTFFTQAFTFLDTMLDSGNNVLVHCSAGYSRSPSFVLAYLLHSHCYPTLMEAFEFVVSNRHVCPNLGFLEQLINWENTTTGTNSITMAAAHDMHPECVHRLALT
ncbi:Dual specificity phosphatase, catalytic domain [Pelomyxa schiedti]|nr:Dual specificity phosphatase, catalytic domain [Pelomyxa schiedti]